MRSMTMAVVLLLSAGCMHDTAAPGGTTPSHPGARAESVPARLAVPSTAPEQTRRSGSRTDATRSTARGFATYYAKMLDGRRTASGIPFDNGAMMAAHPHYPFGTVVRVTNLRNGRSTEVRIVDRGPARRARANGVIIDLSRAAASQLGFITAGRTRVRLDILER